MISTSDPNSKVSLKSLPKSENSSASASLLKLPSLSGTGKKVWKIIRTGSLVHDYGSQQAQHPVSNATCAIIGTRLPSRFTCYF